MAILNSPFSIYCLGHSLGLSDRTLLKEIFTHNRLNTIKLFYRDNPDHYDNLRINVSIIFQANKSYKLKILEVEKSEPMPQVKNNNR